MTYSLDLINSAINYYMTNGKNLRHTAKIFGISKSSLCNWIHNLPLVHRNIDENLNKSKNDLYIKFVKNSLDHNPFQTQKCLLDKLNKKFNVDLNIYFIRIILKNIGYTKKKVSRKLFNKNFYEHKIKRKNFKKIAKKLNYNDTICIDEVGTTKETYNKYGYCHKSKRLQYFVDSKQLPLKRSIIVAISNKKVIHYKILENKNANKEIFIEFMKELTSKISNKIIVMDNVRFHKNDEIKKILKDSNNKELFIPPYSPEFNPIEEVFSLFKSYLRKKINIITGFLNLDKHISNFFNNAVDFDVYYIRSFS